MKSKKPASKKEAPKKTPRVSKPKEVTFVLTREAYDCERGVAGMLLSPEGEFMCYTLELEWKDNQKRKSCIPKGKYEIKYRNWGGYFQRYLRRFMSWHKGMLEVTDVSGRSGILIHIGNTVRDTLGCVLVGSEVDSMKSIIRSSTKAYRSIYPMFAEYLDNGYKVFLEIK